MFVARVGANLSEAIVVVRVFPNPAKEHECLERLSHSP